MIETTAIKSLRNYGFMVIWDTGRFCNYDCTYCESTRHNNYSKHKTLTEFKKTFDFIYLWTALYNSKRKEPPPTNIIVTGGEPTANPNFWKLIDYIQKKDSSLFLSLTTNGAWGKKYQSRIKENFKGITISYHPESSKKYKDRVIQNILDLANTDIWLQVNVMLHVDYWEETTSLFNKLKSLGIRCSPVPIGDGNSVRKGWFIDADGTNRRTSHEYSAEQQEWFYNQLGVENKTKSSNEGNQIGRACCGARELEGKVDNKWQPIKLINTEFKDWYCMVNWFFLYIDQETRNVYHHQTCKATHNGAPGPFGSLDNADTLIEELKIQLENPQPIRCPNQQCRCGMCVPKAKSFEDFKILKETLIA